MDNVNQKHLLCLKKATLYLEHFVKPLLLLVPAPYLSALVCVLKSQLALYLRPPEL